MKSRMEKYFDDTEVTTSRLNKNQNLYKEINSLEVNKYNPNNNVKVIGDNDGIDVDKIKELLENSYKETPRRKMIRIEDNKEEDIDLEPTKEYDINSILKKAHEEKEVDYEKDRLKKLHDTQYDILNNLYKEEKKEEPNEKENELMDLINTITSKEALSKEMDPLELFSDLKGHEETTVMNTLPQMIQEQEKKQEDKKEETLKEALEKTRQNELAGNDKKKKLINSFYTTTNAFTKGDFDEFSDLSGDMDKTKLIIKILIAFAAIVFVVGILFLINNYFNLI